MSSDGEQLDRKLEGRQRARACALPYLERGDGVSWFEAFYREAAGDRERVPWADLEGHPLLIDWMRGRDGAGASALVVGAGLGEDAELCARHGYRVTAFDVAPTAVETCRALWPESSVAYRVADLLDTPPAWRRGFELVVEVYTVQALPPQYRERALDAIAELVAPGGRLVLVTMGRAEGALAPDQIPWPLAPSELARLERLGLVRSGFREVLDDAPLDGEEVPRWCIEYERSTTAAHESPI